jgi:hypothetical protein
MTAQSEGRFGKALDVIEPPSDACIQAARLQLRCGQLQTNFLFKHPGPQTGVKPGDHRIDVVDGKADGGL